MTVEVADIERKQFQAGGNDSVGNNIEVCLAGHEATIRIENPWAGDTVSGFGQTCYIDLPKTDMIKLARWILKTEKQSE